MKTIISLTVLACLTLLAGCATKTDSTETDSNCNGGKTHSWKAWNNLQPGGDKQCHVVGKVSVNSGGWTATLTKSARIPINPDYLFLDLKVTRPSGPTTQPVRDLEVQYAEKLPTNKYKYVHVFCVGKDV